MLPYRSRLSRGFRALVMFCAVTLLLSLLIPPPLQAGRSLQWETPAPASVPLPDAGLAQIAPQSNFTRIFLPLLNSQSVTLTHEQYPLDLSSSQSVVALGGRLSIDIPERSVAYWYFGCTLNVVSPDPQAEWPEVYVYISYTSPPPVSYDQFFEPVTFSFDYSQADLTYLDESRLTLVSSASSDWVPAATPATQAEPAADSIWQVQVDTAAKRAILTTNRATSTIRLAPSYTISDMETGPQGAVYAAAAPIIYTVGDGGDLNRLVNLAELPDAANLQTSFTQFAVNSATGEIYLALRGTSFGDPLKLYGLSGTTLREIYTVPDGEGVTALTYRPGDDVVYLGISVLESSWFGCSIYRNSVRAVNLTDGSTVGSIGIGYGYIRPIADLSVNTSGNLLAVQPTTGCNPDGYTGSHLMTASAGAVLSGFDLSYPGFRGANDLASDGQGRTFIANSSANLISVVQGADSQVIGSIPVISPGALAVSGSDLYVVSNGRLTRLTTSQMTSGGQQVEIVEGTLSGMSSELHVTAAGFAPVPAHHVLYYNGTRFLMNEEDERSFASTKTRLTYPITVAQPSIRSYKPLTQQQARVEFYSNGGMVGSRSIVAPETTYLEWQYGDYLTGPSITIAKNRWANLIFSGALSSEEGLFPDLGAPDAYASNVFIQFTQPGEFHFVNEEDGEPTRYFTATVTAYGAPTSTTATIDPATGGTLWAGGAAMEIPPGALPSRAGGYDVSFSFEANGLNLKDDVADVSPIYKFAFEPEVLRLNQDVLLHLPNSNSGEAPVMAFYDETLEDAYNIPSTSDPTADNYTLLTLSAGDYPATTTALNASRPGVTLDGWLRRGLNWLGNTGVWHAVGLPNEKVENDHFVVIYNTRDGVSEAYAQQVLDALETSRQTLSSTYSYSVPSSQVIVKIAPWITKLTESEGFVPKIGTLGNWYMFFNDKLSTDEIEATAAHEFFHIVQKETSTSARLYAPTWWMEGTAVWAEYAVYPNVKLYQQRLVSGSDFIRLGLRNWNSNAETQYATVAFAIFLEQEYGKGTIKKVFDSFGPLTGMEAALEAGTGASLSDIFEKFAQVYWEQKTSPFNEFVLVNALNTHRLDAAENTVLNASMPALSSRLVKVYYDPQRTPDPPVSFTEADGSVARVLAACSGSRVTLWDASRTKIGLSFIGEADLSRGEQVERLTNYRSTSPIYVLAIMRDGSTCPTTVQLETPTVNSLSPTQVTKGQPARITVSGSGFGPEGMRVLAGGGVYTPVSFNSSQVVFDLPASTLAGSITVRVQHKSGPISNGITLPIVEP